MNRSPALSVTTDETEDGRVLRSTAVAASPLVTVSPPPPPATVLMLFGANAPATSGIAANIPATSAKAKPTFPTVLSLAVACRRQWVANRERGTFDDGRVDLFRC